MKKILAVFDGYNMSKSTIEYSIQLTKRANAHLVGVFLDEFIYRTYSTYKVITTYENYEAVIEELDAKDQKKRDEAAQEFSKICEDANISFSIHRDGNIAIQDLKHESVFADLIVINEYETFAQKKETPPTTFMKELLKVVQCPVLVVPSQYKQFEKLVLLYDGEPSSVYAIKMFSYLFEEMQDLEVDVLTVHEEDKEELSIPDKKLVEEFVYGRFPDASYHLKYGDPEVQILDHLKRNKVNSLVILGAYRRGDLSRMLKESMADVLMKELDVPLFIAHYK